MSPHRPSFTALIRFAAEARGEQWAGELANALSAAIFAGWTWERMFLAVAPLIVDPDASPVGLVDEVQDSPGGEVLAADEMCCPWGCAADCRAAS